MNYYTYKITHKESRQFYIGGRGTKINPINDLGVKYFSSSKTLKKLIKISGSDSFHYEILKDNYSSWKECYDSEQSMIFNEWGNILLLNKSCYYKKKDFGVIDNKSKSKISEKSKMMWSNDDLRKKIINLQKNSWTDDRKEKQSVRLKTEFWSDERKKLHSDKMMGHKGSIKLKGVKKPIGFGNKISEKMKNKNKTVLHKENLSKSRQGKKFPHLRKLSSEIISEIYCKLNNGSNYKIIMEEYNLSMSMVYRIKNKVITP